MHPYRQCSGVGAVSTQLSPGSKSITERYAHANLDALREAVATLDGKTGNQTGTKPEHRLFF